MFKTLSLSDSDDYLDESSRSDTLYIPDEESSEDSSDSSSEDSSRSRVYMPSPQVYPGHGGHGSCSINPLHGVPSTRLRGKPTNVPPVREA